MKDFFYTILIPHHNTPLLLKRCLDSIPRRKDIQVIVVDDCSKEDCKWVNTYGDHWGETILVENKIPKGAGHARNVGMEHIKGRYVIFADCDDFFSEKFDLILEMYKGTDYDLIYFNARSVCSDQIDKESTRANHVQEYIQDYVHKKNLDNLRYFFTEPWCKIISMQLIIDNDIQFEETIVANDYMFSIKVGYFASKIAVETIVGYVITFRLGSLSVGSQSIDKILTRIAVSQRAYDFYKNHNLNCKEPYLGGLMCFLLKQSPPKFFFVFSKMLFKGHWGQLTLFFQFLFYKIFPNFNHSRN